MTKTYSISEVASMMGVAPSTLRYYEKEGLLPNVKRVNGKRVFEEKDFGWLRVLNCLKNTGMPIRRIKEYALLSQMGDESLSARYELIKAQREYVQDQIDRLNYYMKELDYKDWYYRTAIELGSEKAVQNTSKAKEMNLDTIPEKEDFK